MKLLEVILVQHVLICVARCSEKVSVVTDDALSTNNMYLYKTYGQSENYLNYRAVYGLRYTPTKKPMKATNFMIEDEEHKWNSSIAAEVISASEDVNVEHAPSGVESETVSEMSVASSQSSATLPRRNFSTESMEPVVDESRNHIMRPNNRVGYALDFLAERLKKLLYYSADRSRPESKLSPQLTSLGRFLNLFRLIKFENIPCITAQKPLRQMSGTCYSEVECLGLGGIAVDSCASGFGVCCVFKGGCSSVTHQNVTYFESPQFPLASQSNLGSCSLTLLLARDVKQVLVDFLFFELLPPTDGDCEDDRLIIMGQAMNYDVPIICGINTGQHMFIDVENSDKLHFNVLTRTADDRAFSIKVTQLRDNLAPQGCFQYHRNSEGIIKTFNYDDNSQIQMIRRPSYFNNLNYSICIRRNSGFCQITYSNELNGREDIFDMVNVDDDGNIIPGMGQAGAEIFSCNDDFIAVNFIRLCGSKLNDGSQSGNFNLNIPVQSYMNGPINIPVKTNNNTVGRGFKIYYFQDRCDLL